MSLSRVLPVRMLTVLPLVLALSATMLVGYTLSPAAPKANAALVSAAKANAAADWARSRKGSPYQYGATGPRRFDCSGLTRWVYSKVGKSLPHSSSAQVSRTERLSKSERRRGDLVFFYGYGGVYHVAIYAGQGYVWHASRPGVPVKRTKIWTSRVFYGRVK
ncbi:MAG TPA: C40 family peptidase [Nocardioidaceae bacterium]|nr:C40 family peptidase [Nocardioidaceae bacterium]